MTPDSSQLSSLSRVVHLLLFRQLMVFLFHLLAGVFFLHPLSIFLLFLMFLSSPCS
ncbi:hypothetical protein PAHAL_4G152200 [Panicum hallii]|uniref:Uncharacterized protein n=1 Tax=Panicum hallii TaxID=206008 RepID=A0A2T8JCY5_9POAL|nr:hypothetical protein PAHAL_4G152200 [Panicum hallii]